ncbi:hypothetical protein M997_1563 [Proteus hauseri ATCC 700826]|uniref:Uncharacterized protein n=1 Tax=Proteus hauseri ATCC 700826 TaxID=1354271 RepID=A0AAJ3LUL3_PROHU|nr:hypothetical protein M997_1563 [Proteus hauseri ATCC 700826]
MKRIFMGLLSTISIGAIAKNAEGNKYPNFSKNLNRQNN